MSHDGITRNRIRKVTRERVPESNVIAAKIFLIIAGASFIAFVIFQLGLLKSQSFFINISLLVMPILFIITSICCLIKKGRGVAFQYIFLAQFLIFWLGIDIMSGYKSKLLLPIFMIISLRYYNRRFTIFTYIASSIAALASTWSNAYLYRQTGLLDLNMVNMKGYNSLIFNGNLIDEVIALNPSSSGLFFNGLILSFLPNLVFLTFVLIVTMLYMEYNLSNILKAEEIAELEARQQLELFDMKTKVMLSQVKPHFVYNTLSSITSLCYIDPERAAALTMDFSDYLRNNLDTLGENSNAFCTFEAELDHIKKYLNIELVRFEDELHVEYDIQDMNFSVPVLSIQPIVENAVKHGVSKKMGGGTVKINSYKVDGGHMIIVSDDGIGFDPDKQMDDGKTHVGIENIKKRISIFGGRINIESTENVGTTVTVFIPEEGGSGK